MEQKEFIEAVEKLRGIAEKNNNHIKKADIDKGLADSGINLDEKQLKMVYAYLKTSKITIDEFDGTADITGADETGDMPEIADAADSEENYMDDNEVVNMYLEDIRGIKTLSEEELLEAMKKLACGSDERTIESVINTFLKNTVKWVKSFEEGAVLMTDLIQEGNMGLMSEVKSFDYKKALESGNPVRMLKDALKKAVIKAAADAVYEQDGENNVAYKIAGRVNAVNDCAKELSDELNRKVTIDEVAEKMDMSYDEIKEIIDLSSNKIEYITS